jgi:hypothetical protein
METTNREPTDNFQIAEIIKKLRISEARITALEAENKKLLDEIVILRSKKPNDASNEYVETSGVLWKRNRSGGFESVPYCPTCKSTLADYSGSLLCLKCNWQAPLKSFEAPKVYHDLSGEWQNGRSS